MMHVGARLNEYDGKHGAFREFPSRESGDCPRGFVGLTRIDVTRARARARNNSRLVAFGIRAVETRARSTRFSTFDSRNACFEGEDFPFLWIPPRGPGNY